LRSRADYTHLITLPALPREEPEPTIIIFYSDVDHQQKTTMALRHRSTGTPTGTLPYGSTNTSLWKDKKTLMAFRHNDAHRDV